MKITWKLKGKVAVIRGLDDVDKKARRKLRRIVTSHAKRVLSDAAKRVPVSSGELKKSLRVKTKRSMGASSAILSLVGSDLKYARYVEFGTRKGGGLLTGGGLFGAFSGGGGGGGGGGHKPQPFLYPAIRASSRRFRSDVMRAINKLKIHG